MRKLIILDYKNKVVHDYIISSNINIDEEYISKLGFDSNCEWMCGEDVDIIFHKEVLK